MLISILQEGHTEIVELFLMTPGVDVNPVTGNHTEIVEVWRLLKTPGIEVNITTINRWTPLHWAASVSYKHYLTYSL